MEKCLVSVLDSVVNNQNLPYINGLDINIDDNNSGGLYIYSNKKIPDNVIINLTDGTIISEETAGYQGKITVSSATNGKIVLKDIVNYGIKSIGNSGGVFPDSIINYDTAFYRKLKYIDTLTQINASGKNVTGEMVDFVKITTLEYVILGITRNNILRTSKVTGTIEEFADGQVENGRTSGSCQVYCNGIITYQGIAPAAETVKVITFNPSSPGGYTISNL